MAEAAGDGAARDGVRGRVDAILSELGFSPELDEDGDWRLKTDVGPFLLVIDGANDDLVAIQTLKSIEGELEAHAHDMHFLMRLNVEAECARFAALRDAEADLLILSARVRSESLSTESVGRMLDDATRLSRRLDEVVGNAGESDGAPG